MSARDENHRILQPVCRASNKVHRAVKTRISKSVYNIIYSVLIVGREPAGAVQRWVPLSIKPDNCDSTAMIGECDETLRECAARTVVGEVQPALELHIKSLAGGFD